MSRQAPLELSAAGADVFRHKWASRQNVMEQINRLVAFIRLDTINGENQSADNSHVFLPQPIPGCWLVRNTVQ